MNVRSLLKKSSALIAVLVLSGCATYGTGLDAALKSAQQGDYVSAEQGITKNLKPDGADRLLYNLELAVLKHLQGQYTESNRLLGVAERIAEDLETTSVGNSLAAFMTNPRQGDYAGSDFEKVFINYYKALNYLALASQAATKNDRLDAIESARIESRRLGIRLNALNSDKGTYQEQKDKDEQLFSQIMDVFDKLQGNLIDFDKLEYRDDAMAHYLTGISFEANGEFDNARISYQKAAKSYEEGFAEQFKLGSDMTKQAWFDTVRMMRKAGGYNNEWPRLAKKKLSKAQRQQLKDYDGKSQLVVIEHVGMVPHRKEMNVQLSVNSYTKSLELRPYFGTGNTQLEKLAWFYVVYADKSLLDLVANYYDATFVGFILNDFTKTIPLGPAWDSAAQLGLINAIGSGLRITVPYYAPPKEKPGASFVSLDGKQYNMKSASNPAVMGLNEQLLSANTDIQLALARGAFKALTAQKAGELAGGQFGGLLATVGNLAAQLSDAAETRNWLMLPYEVRVTRIPVEAGSYSLDINSVVHKGAPAIKQSRQVVVQENELQLVQVRSMPYQKQAAVTPAAEAALKAIAEKN
jgi:hypothetical protein